ncbi:MAG: response regulator transcription factor, partial [Prevotella sp.]|nr:response regulator transcription factor [Prevotella sp.]
MSITSSNSLINEYLERGFGTMTKREFEVMILHDLLQNELKGKSNYEISRKLGITEAKVKGLVYEVSLKYDKDEETWKQRFMQAIQKVNLF